MNRIKPYAESQRNFRTTPEGVLLKLNNLPSREFVVSCLRKISETEISNGDFAHLGISLVDDAPEFPASQIPIALIGKFATLNSEGIEVVRQDLPKVSKTFSFEAPDWGDWSNGSHTVYWDREVYPREFIAPKLVALNIELVATEELSTEAIYVFKFTVDEVLDRDAVVPETEDLRIKNDLFFNLNLLQECVGRSDVFSTEATREEYLRSLYVNWEILPVGERDEVVARILSGVRAPSEELRQTVAERYDFLVTLNPQDFVHGISGMRRYFGARFAEDLVVFENLEYGNAMYVMFDDWEDLSKRSRPELLKSDRRGFERIVHSNGWKRRLEELLEDRLN